MSESINIEDDPRYDIMPSVRAELKRLREIVSDAEGILSWVMKQHEKLENAEDGTPAWIILDFILSKIHKPRI